MAIQQITQLNPDGARLGQSTADLVALWGATPTTQPAATAQATVTDATGGTAAATNGVLTITATYNQTILANALASILAQTNAMRTALVAAGIMKGSA